MGKSSRVGNTRVVIRAKVTADVAFSESQIKELMSELGVTSKQVQELHQSLPMIRAWLVPAASLNEVREEFQKLRGALQQALDACTSVLASDLSQVALAEIHSRICDAIVQSGRDDYPLKKVSVLLRQELTLVDLAASSLGPSKPRRFQSAFQPIAWIEEALERGWTATHELPAREDGFINLADVPPFPHAASRQGPFARIAGICYQACAGTQDDVDGYQPEAPIKAYLAFKRKQRKIAG